MRSACEKLSAITCSALIDSGLVVMLPSEVTTDPSRVPMATTEAARISPHGATTRHGWTAETPARYCGIDVRLGCASCPSRTFERVADMCVFLSLLRLFGARALGGDPGGQDVVGVVGQVVADQGVEQGGAIVHVGGGKGDELPVPCGDGVRRCPG